MWSVVKFAARAALWRPTRELQLVGLPALLGFAVALALVRMAIQFAAAYPTPEINPYGLNAVVAWLALELAIAALFVRPAGRATALSAMLVLSIIGEIVSATIKIGASLLASAATSPWADTIAASAVFIIEIVWWLGAMLCVLRSLQAQPRAQLIGRVAGLWVALFAVNALLPHMPLFLPPDFDMRGANVWEALRARYMADSGGNQQPQSAAVAQLQAVQPKLLRGEVAALAPRLKGTTDFYAIGLAGWADQDVFIKELDGGLAALGNVLPIKDRTIRLINNRQTLDSVPFANRNNFGAAVHAIANAMDKNDDVLVLLMTSHGDHNGLALQLPGAGVTALTPQDVASTLDGEGIKNRVVIVSACYAGIFVPPLANDNTIVITAADDKSTSFGCAPERDWTYFGDALFRQSIKPGLDLQHAFEQARVLIQGWELMDRVPPSNPQARFGPALVAKLAPIIAGRPATAASNSP